MPSNRLPVTAIIVLLLFVYVAHALGGVLHIAGAQLAPSIAVYTLMALLLAPTVGWGGLVALAAVIALLTTFATTSAAPAANIPAHGLAFLFAASLAKRWSSDRRMIPAGRIVAVTAVTTLVSWTLRATVTWLVLAETAFAATSWTSLGIDFGSGFFAWWISGFVTIGLPTLTVSCIATPILYRLGRPLLNR